MELERPSHHASNRTQECTTPPRTFDDEHSLGHPATTTALADPACHPIVAARENRRRWLGHGALYQTCKCILCWIVIVLAIFLTSAIIAIIQRATGYNTTADNRTEALSTVHEATSTETGPIVTTVQALTNVAAPQTTHKFEREWAAEPETRGRGGEYKRQGKDFPIFPLVINITQVICTMTTFIGPFPVSGQTGVLTALGRRQTVAVSVAQATSVSCETEIIQIVPASGPVIWQPTSTLPGQSRAQNVMSTAPVAGAATAGFGTSVHLPRRTDGAGVGSGSTDPADDYGRKHKGAAHPTMKYGAGAVAACIGFLLVVWFVF